MERIKLTDLSVLAEKSNLPESSDIYKKTIISTDISDDGKTMIVGRKLTMDPSNIQKYVNNEIDMSKTGIVSFYSKVDDKWVMIKTIVSDDKSKNFIGTNVKISGNGKVAVIKYVDTAIAEGKVDIYINTDKGWEYTETLTSNQNDLEFGDNIDISFDGRTIVIGFVIGLPIATNDSIIQKGAVWVYKTTNDFKDYEEYTVWDDSIKNGDMYGASLELSSDGTRLVVTSKATSDINYDCVGSVYVYSLSANSGPIEVRLSPWNIYPNNIKTAISGDGKTLVMLANNDDYVSSIFIYKLISGKWAPVNKLDKSIENLSCNLFGLKAFLSKTGDKLVLIGAYEACLFVEENYQYELKSTIVIDNIEEFSKLGDLFIDKSSMVTSDLQKVISGIVTIDDNDEISRVEDSLFVFDF